MVEKGARDGKGLGKGLQGMLRAITVIQKKDKFRLGYKPDKKGRQRLVEEKKDRQLSRE